MKNTLLIKEAREDGEIIGFRIVLNGEGLMIFKNQKDMPGFRVGGKFVPSFKKTIKYTTLLAIKI